MEVEDDDECSYSGSEDEDDGEEEDEEPAGVQLSRGHRRRAPRPPQFDELIDDLGVI